MSLESQLYEDLLFDYIKIPRPVMNSSDVLVIDVGASLIRIIDVDEKNQILTTNLWLDMVRFLSFLLRFSSFGHRLSKKTLLFIYLPCCRSGWMPSCAGTRTSTAGSRRCTSPAT